MTKHKIMGLRVATVLGATVEFSSPANSPKTKGDIVAIEKHGVVAKQRKTGKRYWIAFGHFDIIEMSGNWILELEPGVWLADASGDPGRTLRKESARKFKTRRGAVNALTAARRQARKQFETADIYQVEQE